MNLYASKSEFQIIKLPFRVKKKVLALGSQRKNTLCFIHGDTAELTRIHQDLSNPSDFLAFEKSVEHFLRKAPQIIAYDLHPEYESTRYLEVLKKNKYQLVAVQHHHAHIASCMAENALKNQRVIGVALDGTGMGDDQRLWGAEFFVCDYVKYTRKAHLRYIPLLGGEKAIRQPWRLALAWLLLAYKQKMTGSGRGYLKKLSQKQLAVLLKMYKSGFNSPQASSMGRLFDAVASLILHKFTVKFEAEAAIALEKLAAGWHLPASAYSFKIVRAKDDYIIDPAPMFKEIIRDLRAGQDKRKIAYAFHLSAARMVERVCLILGRQLRIKQVVLCGGVMQNKVLLGLISDLLYKHKFCLSHHRQLSANDAAISLGQAAIAGFLR